MHEHTAPARDPLLQSLKGELKIELKLPDEVSLLCKDLHDDRQVIGVGALVALALLGVLAFNALFRRK